MKRKQASVRVSIKSFSFNYLFIPTNHPTMYLYVCININKKINLSFKKRLKWLNIQRE